MWRLETPVRAGDGDAVVERRWETTKDDPVCESVIVKALAADKTRAKRRKMVWYVFIVENYFAMGIVSERESNVLLIVVLDWRTNQVLVDVVVTLFRSLFHRLLRCRPSPRHQLHY
jgi:hypothetical protein